MGDWATQLAGSRKDKKSKRAAGIAEAQKPKTAKKPKSKKKKKSTSPDVAE